MTKEEKKLLFKDLSARQLYGVMLNVKGQDGPNLFDFNEELYSILIDGEYMSINDRGSGDELGICEIKPYLRSMLSITENEMDEIRKRINKNCNTGRLITKDNFQKMNDWIWFCDMREWECVGNIMMGEVIDFLNEKMLDWRGLIKKNLAIEVTEENNPYI